MKTVVKVTYLEMTEPGQFIPSRSEGSLNVVRAEISCPELNRFFYTAVGGDWYWLDRLSWTYERWVKWLDRPEVETWVGYHKGTPIGYFELENKPESGVEIAYFGLLPQFVGQGLGGQLLTAAVRRGWALGPKRVWLHTCTLDHPRAVANYVARGFRPYKEEAKVEDLPDQSPGPWPGASRSSGRDL